MTVATEPGHGSRLRRALTHPVRVVVLGFAGAITVGTVLLMLPTASQGPGGTDLVTALFTATSAVCVTGLVVVDTSGHWSTFGELVILGLIQVGGLGIMTLAALIVLAVGNRLGIRASMLTEAEARGGNGGHVAGQGAAAVVVLGVVRISLLFELVLALALTARFRFGYDHDWTDAAYHGVFHAVSAFNNAGFALWPDSLERFVQDPWICVPVMVAIVCGGIGFPVLTEMSRRWRRPRSWSLHARITITATALLLVGGTLVVTAAEWGNPNTLGPLSGPGKVLAGAFHSVNTRTAGFNTVPVGDMHPQTLLASDVLMFIGGGSGGTAGGIKVTTFLLLGYVLWAELRGERQVSAARRLIPADVQRQALTVALLSVAAVVASTWTLLVLTPLPSDAVLFETVSAFGTVGLSTGITAQLPTTGHLLLTGLMFLGRLGPLTLGAALALRSRPQRFSYPPERPIVG